MFAELEVLTDKTSTPVIAIPTASVVDANGKKVVYIQNGNAFQSTEVTLGQTSGNMVEIKSGLFDGDVVVTQRATQLYAQSLRGGSKPASGETKEGHTHTEATQVKANLPIPLWLFGAGGAAVIGAGAFAAGNFWSSRRMRGSFVPVAHPKYEGFIYETETHIDNHKQPTPSPSVSVSEKEDSNINM